MPLLYFLLGALVFWLGQALPPEIPWEPQPPRGEPARDAGADRELAKDIEALLSYTGEENENRDTRT